MNAGGGVAPLKSPAIEVRRFFIIRPVEAWPA